MVESQNSDVAHSGLIYRFGSCSVDTMLREIRVDDTVVDVQPKVFELLLFLIENRHRMVDKDELFSQIWPTSIVTESSLTQAMRKARAIIGDDGNRQEIIRTVQKRGYRFIAPIKLTRVSTPESGNAGPWPRRAITLGAALLMLTTAILIALWQLLQDDAGIESQTATQLMTPPKLETPANSIAVLPFADMSEDRTGEYFADGLSEELLNLLANIPNLHVAARTSSFSFKETKADIPLIAERLRVAHILQGSVRVAGDRVRITVQLIDAATGYHLWSENFDRDFDDIFLVQEEIAIAVTQSLRVTMLSDQPATFLAADPAAYTLFLQGRYFLRLSTPVSIEQSIDHLQRATLLDPNFARCWHLLGSAYIRQANFGLIPYNEGYTKGREAVMRALELDPTLAAAHAQLGWIALHHDFDITSARRHIEQALTLEPRNYESISYAGTVALGLGRLDDAIALREQVVAIDPLGRGGYHNLGLALYYAKRLDEAEAMYRKALALSPDYLSGHYFLGLVLLAKGEPQSALKSFERETDDAWRLEGRALAFHRLRRPDESATTLALLTAEYGEDMTYQIGEVHAYRGENDASFTWLERAYERRDGGLWEMSFSPLLIGLHEDPRWDALLSKMGFTD